MYIKSFLLTLLLGLSLAFAQPPHHKSPPKKKHPPRPYIVVVTEKTVPKETEFHFKYSLKAHGINCKVKNTAKVIDNYDGTITVVVNCSF